MISEGIDIAIRIGSLSDSGLVARKLAPIKMIAAASPDYLTAHGRPQRPEDLKKLKELRYSNRARKSWTYKDMTGRSGSIEMTASMKSNNGDFLREAAIAGWGVVIEPSFLLCDAVRDNSLDVILPEYDWSDISAYAIYPPTRHLSLRVRMFVDFLVERFKGTPPWDEGLF